MNRDLEIEDLEEECEAPSEPKALNEVNNKVANESVLLTSVLIDYEMFLR